MATKYEYRVSGLPDVPVIDHYGNVRPNSVWGSTYFVDYRNGADTNNGLSSGNAFKTLSKAYSTVTSNNNDLVLCDGDSTIAETAMITWAKNRVNVVGVGGGFLTGQGTKLELSTVAGDYAATLTMTGVRNHFANFKIMNSGTHANSISSVVDSSEAGVWSNCSFMKFSDLDQTGVSDFEVRSDSTSYVNCEFGFDTLTQSVARPTVRIKGSGDTKLTHTRWVGCIFTCQSSSADKEHIKVENAASVRYENVFKECDFIAAINGTNSAVTLTNAVASAAGLVEGNLVFIRPATNATNFCAGTTDNVKLIAAAASNNASEGVVPA